MRRSSEPLWWLPFAGGMMVDALTMPALVVITGLLIPLGIVNADELRVLLLHPLTRFVLFVIVSLTFFHAAHRLRYALVDLGFRALKPVMGLLCYGGAAALTLWAAAVALGVI